MYSNKIIINTEKEAIDYKMFMEEHYIVKNWDLQLPTKYPCLIVECIDFDSGCKKELCFIEYVYIDDFEN